MGDMQRFLWKFCKESREVKHARCIISSFFFFFLFDERNVFLIFGLDWEKKSWKKISSRMRNKGTLETCRQQTKVLFWIYRRTRGRDQIHLNMIRTLVRQKPSITAWMLTMRLTWRFPKVHCTLTLHHHHLIWIPNWIFTSATFQGRHRQSLSHQLKFCCETYKSCSKWCWRTPFNMNNK